MSDDQKDDQGDPQTAAVEFQAGPIHYRAEVRVTPIGILAVGALMSGALLATAVLVWASTSVGRTRAQNKNALR